MHFIEETHTEVNLSLEEHYFIAKREVDDFVNRKTGNEVDQDLNQKSTIKRYSDIKSEENFETHIEEILSLKKYPLNAESLTVKKELDDFDNGKTAKEVAEDFDHKSITIHSYVKSEEEEENLKNSQYLISHDEINIKSEDVVESSARFAQPNTTVELNKLKLKLKLKMLCDPKKNLPDKVNTTMKRYKNHKVSHNSKVQGKIHKCPDCPYQSKNKSHIKQHSVRHKMPDEIEWYRCTKCLYKTDRKYSLQQHAISHTDTCQFEIFKCAHCVYKTGRKQNLKRHLLVHLENIPRLNCPEPDCPYKTHDKATLRRHSQVHNNAQFLKCTQCPYQAVRQDYLKSHQLKHDTTDKWHACPKCSFRTIRKYSLNQHIRRHANL